MTTIGQSLIRGDCVVESKVNFVPEELLLHELLKREWLKCPDSEALSDVDFNQKVSYKQLLNLVQRQASYLQTHGVRPGMFVAFTAANSLNAVIKWLALIFCRCVVVVPKYSLTAFELAELISELPIEAAVGDGVSTEKFRSVQKNHSTLKLIFCIEDQRSAKEFEGLANEAYKEPISANPRTTPLFLLFTSGSTGRSKAVKCSHFNFVASINAFRLSFTPEDIVHLIVSSMSHLSGILTILSALAQGAKAVVANEHLKEDICRVAEVVRGHSVTTFLAMPFMLNALVNAPLDVKKKFIGIKTIKTGGSVISKATIESMKKSFPGVQRFCNVYGLSETCGAVAESHCMFVEGPGLHVSYNMSLKVVDPITSKTLGPNKPGEIWIRGPIIALGYFNNPVATESTFVENGWLRSGDVGFYDEHERFFIVDRLKEMIKCLDFQVAPSDLEAVLLQNAAVTAVIVVGVPDEKYGEAPTAFIVPKQQNTDKLATLRQALQALVRNRCAAHKQLYGGIYFLNDLPKTESGKYARRQILEDHLANRLSYLGP